MKKESRLDHLWSQLKSTYSKKKKGVVIYFTVIRVLIFMMMIFQLVQLDFENAGLCFFTLILSILPALLSAIFRVEFSNALEVFFLTFVFCAEICGEVLNFFWVIKWWDTMLHTISGFVLAGVGFAIMLFFLQNQKYPKISSILVAMYSFCFALTLGVLWEFFEFGADQIVKSDMQKDRVIQEIASVYIDPEHKNHSIVVDNIAYTVLYDKDGNVLLTIDGGYLDIGLRDTMKDLIVSTIGALLCSIDIYFYVYSNDKFHISEKFLIKSTEDNILYEKNIMKEQVMEKKKEKKEQTEKEELQ